MMARAIFLACLAALLVFAIAVLVKVPRHDRSWQPHLSRLPVVSLNDGRFSIQEYRDWSYPAGGEPVQVWKTLPELQVQDVRRVWLIVEPHPSLPVMAHTLVLFEFQDGELIGLTVEARKQAGEKYSPLRGALNAFELIYQWATPQDLLTRRANYLGHELYMYPLALTQGETEAYLTALLDKTKHIETHPRFYNTLTSNCTNELAKAARLSWHPAFVFTGKSPDALYRMDRIAGDGAFEELKANARIDPLVKSIAAETGARFNAALIDAKTVTSTE